MRFGKLVVFGLSMVFIGAAFAEGEPVVTDAVKRKTVTSKWYVDQKIAEKQEVLNKNNNTWNNNVVVYGSSDGQLTNKPIIPDINNETRTTLTAQTGESQATIDTYLPTVAAVSGDLNSKQNKLGNQMTDGYVATYTSTDGTLSEKAVYNTGAAYNNNNTNQNALIEAAHANDAIQDGLNKHLTCGGTQNGQPDGTCWLWTVNEQTSSDFYTDSTDHVSAGGN